MPFWILTIELQLVITIVQDTGKSYVVRSAGAHAKVHGVIVAVQGRHVASSRIREAVSIDVAMLYI